MVSHLIDCSWTIFLSFFFIVKTVTASGYGFEKPQHEHLSELNKLFIIYIV